MLQTENPGVKLPDVSGVAKPSTRVALLVVLITGVSFFTGFLLGDLRRARHDTEEFKVFWRSWDILDRDFYFDLPAERALVHGAIQGLLATTGDPLTFFAPPVSAELDRHYTAGEFGGIGAYIVQNERGQLIITRPFVGMPASEAGLQDGDILIAIDGVPTESWSQAMAVSKLRGEVGSVVEVEVLRPESNTLLSTRIIRARVELPTVESSLISQIGYVRLFHFNDKATSALARDIEALLEQGARALILDLRGNPGGLLDQAVGVADLFLDSGVVVGQRNRSGNERVYEAKQGDIAETVPLVVLIDNGSASASEVVAGALQNHGRAILVGQASYGKGSVQHVYDMQDGSQLHVTVAVWFTPDGMPIQGQGLVPDIDVSHADSLPGDGDGILDAALDYLMELDTF